VHQNAFGGWPGSARTRWGLYSVPQLSIPQLDERGGEEERARVRRGRGRTPMSEVR